MKTIKTIKYSQFSRSNMVLTAEVIQNRLLKEGMDQFICWKIADEINDVLLRYDTLNINGIGYDKNSIKE